MNENIKSPNRRRRSGLVRFLRDEEGAAYSLSFVMVIPIFALMICLIIEGALIMTAKLGTVYAAFAAARTASVWSSHTSCAPATGLALLCPITSQVKGYPFEVPMPEGQKVRGVALADQVKSLDWRARKVSRYSRVPPEVLAQVLQRLVALMGG